MEKIAGFAILILGRLTIAILHIFEKLGVDMSAFDEALARLTAFTSAQASALRDARQTINSQHAEIDKLVSEDAAQDQIDIADAVKKALDEAAAQLDEVTNNLDNPPVDQIPDVPPVEDPPAEEPPVTDPPVDEQPPVVTDPAPPVEEPPVVPGPPDTPPSGDVPVTDVPVVPSGDPDNVPPESVPDPVPVEPVDPGLDPSVPVTPVDQLGDPVTPEEPPVATDPAPADPSVDPAPVEDVPADAPAPDVTDGGIGTTDQ